MSVKTICLPTEDHTPYEMVVVGFGMTENSNISEELLSAQLAYCPSVPCNEIYKELVLSDTWFCAVGVESEKSDSCKGDSGKLTDL